MARNGSGTHSVPNSFSAGSTIESPAMNANFTDIASEITNSLPRDGQAAMTGQMKAASGTVALPGMTFGADTDTGFYRKSTNQIGVVAGGVEIGSFGPDNFLDTGGNKMTAFPSGTVMLFIQTAAPTGWTKSTTHNNKALRIVSGTVGQGGSTAFTDVFTARTITQANLPDVGLVSTSLSAVSATSVSISGGTIAGTAATTTLRNDGSSSGIVTATAISASATTTTTISGVVPLGGSGTSMNFAVQYVDAIIASRD